MKVIKQVEPVKKVFEKTCGYCKSELEYDMSDVESDRDGSYIICPSCGKFLAHVVQIIQ